ncbi:MAG: RHS repeat-associated core domain-containing protein [Planctomycetota bacterium]
MNRVDADGDGSPDAWDSGQTDYFGTDGHGSVRVLYDLASAIVQDVQNNLPQIYHFDAYGNLLNFDTATPLTSYLYSGEAFDFNIGQQYLRARWYDATTGRFNRLDPFAGNATDPQSFHKYAYVHGDPIQGTDPTGLFLASNITITAVDVALLSGIVGLSFLTLLFANNLEFRWPRIDWELWITAGAIAAMEADVAEQIAEHAWNDEAKVEVFEELGLVTPEILADYIQDLAEAGLAEEAGTLLKDGLERGRTAVRDLETELVLIWNVITGAEGTIYRPDNPDYTWINTIK